MVLKGYKISKIDQPDGAESGSLSGITANEHDATDREKEFLASIISRLNELFDDTSDDEGQRHFVNQLVNGVSGNEQVAEQIDKNTKEQAMAGDLPNEVKKNIVRAMKSHQDLARIPLADQDALMKISSMIYDIMKFEDGENTNTIL